MLGRIAAIQHERYDLPIDLQLDSVQFFLDSAIMLSSQLEINEHLPSLQREYGVLLIEKDSLAAGLKYLDQAATVFLAQGWALCDGRTVNNIKTPDLQGRFIAGVDSTNTN